VYWLGSRGICDLQAAGEASNRSRELAGRFSNIQVHETTGSGLAAPNYFTTFRDIGFERHGSDTNFLRHGQQAKGAAWLPIERRASWAQP
jgi:hypothetical protein